MEDLEKLRELAAWYRTFAEKAANPAIWEARLKTAEDFEREASAIERRKRVNLGYVEDEQSPSTTEPASPSWEPAPLNDELRQLGCNSSNLT